MLFGLKKIFSALLLPLPLSLLFLLLGLFLLWTREAKSIRNCCFIAGFSILLIFSLSPVSNALINTLQSQYKPLVDVPSLVTRVVVLGGGNVTKKNYPANLSIQASSLSRLIEGIRLFKIIQKVNPHAELVLSGGRVFQSIDEAGQMRNIAVMLGVNPTNIIIENGSQDTKDEAMFLKSKLGDEPFLLVTSAFHMPRAMMLFKQSGMNPIAAPTQFYDESVNPITHYLPDTRNLLVSDVAIHEYLGVLWAKSTQSRHA